LRFDLLWPAWIVDLRQSGGDPSWALIHAQGRIGNQAVLAGLADRRFSLPEAD